VTIENEFQNRLQVMKYLQVLEAVADDSSNARLSLHAMLVVSMTMDPSEEFTLECDGHPPLTTTVRIFREVATAYVAQSYAQQFLRERIR
jgi:hypothetical protein